MTFEADASVYVMPDDDNFRRADDRDARLATKAARLHDAIIQRDRHFRRTVMADGPMAIMLSLFQSELDGVQLTMPTLALVNMLDDGEADAILAKLVHAGLVVVSGENLERRTVGLSALGSARMRSYVGDLTIL